MGSKLDPWHHGLFEIEAVINKVAKLERRRGTVTITKLKPFHRPAATVDDDGESELQPEELTPFQPPTEGW